MTPLKGSLGGTMVGVVTDSETIDLNHGTSILQMQGNLGKSTY